MLHNIDHRVSCFLNFLTVDRMPIRILVHSVRLDYECILGEIQSLMVPSGLVKLLSSDWIITVRERG